MHYPLLLRINSQWIITGSLLIVLFVILSVLSGSFASEIPLSQQPILWMIGLLVFSGLIFLYLTERLIHLKGTKHLFFWIFIVGTLMRFMMLFSTPMLEVDYNRYLWDGALVANGYNPYAFSPQEIQQARADNSHIPAGILSLAEQAGPILDNINHPHLRTIYPIVTQSAFALAHFLKPWSLTAWRGVLLLFDIASLLLLIYVLRYLRLSPLWITVYWLNPLLIKEIFNSGHMDILIFPFLLAAILFSIQNKPYPAVTMLALAIAVKIWPILLAPIIFRNTVSDGKRAATALMLFGTLCLLFFSPVILTDFDQSSGFQAYTYRWQLNDSLFRIILWGSQSTLSAIGIHPGHGQVAARTIVALILFTLIVYLTIRKTEEPRQLFQQCLLVTAGLFLLSPTQFPWYCLWMIPFLAIAPRRSLLLLTAVLPLYYLWHYYSAIGKVELFNRWVVWVEFVPVWILLLREWVLNHQNKMKIDNYSSVLPEKQNDFGQNY